MVDFDDLAKQRDDLPVPIPTELYEKLDREVSHISLRPEQREAVSALWTCRDRRDVVLKMATGAGKTTVGLLYLYTTGLMEKRPVVYLCPTVQLVEQVLQEAQKAGIPAHDYPRGQSHPHADCLQGGAVIVCTYSKLFNAQTTFDRSELQLTPQALVLDDAHTGIDYVSNAFTVRVSATEEKTAHVFRELRKLIAGVARNYHRSRWEEIEQGDARAVMELPYWSWQPIAKQAAEIIGTSGAKDPLVFHWPFIKDGLEKCRCLVSADAIELTPVLPLVERVRAYDSAAHRVFMSATLLDDTLLVREFGADKEAVMSPLEIGSGTGERMILVPSLVSPELNRNWVIEWAKSLAPWKRVAVLSPSEKLAADWVKAGATLGIGDDAARVAAQLRAGTINFAVLVQRYDGVDLPDDACRLLIFDGLPIGESLADKFDGSKALLPGGARHRLVHRIEQGMGRAVRSPADYAVVVLAGADLGMFVSRGDVQAQFTDFTRKEIVLADFMAKEARKNQSSDAGKIVHDMAVKCLQRDTGWKAFYEQRVRKALKGVAPVLSKDAVDKAQAERQSVEDLWAGDTPRAVADLDVAINGTSGEEKARLLQEQARVKCLIDSAGALALQKVAFDLSKRMLLPPMGTQRRIRSASDASAATTLYRWVHDSANSNAPVLFATHVKEWLTLQSSHKQLEQALAEMAVFFGAEGIQAEHDYGEGAPDDLIQWPEKSLVIEAKQGESPHIIKADAEQLLHSVQWFNDSFPGRNCVPVLATRSARVGPGVHLPDGTRIITQPQLEAIAKAIEGLAAKLAERAPLDWTEPMIESLLGAYKLGPASFIGHFTIEPE